MISIRTKFGPAGCKRTLLPTARVVAGISYCKLKKTLGLMLAGLTLSACVTTPGAVSQSGASKPNTVADKPQAGIDSTRLAKEGIQFLEKGDLARALQLFNAAVKYDPERAEYHLLVGITYHLQFLGGGAEEPRNGAEIGYRLAARFDPMSTLPLLQLGRLHTDARRYQEASLDFAKAVELVPNDADALYGLAITSYLTGDLKTSLWAADNLEKQHWNALELNRLRAVLFTAVNAPEQAAHYRNAYAEANPMTPAGLKAFDGRLNQINAMFVRQSWLKNPDQGASAAPQASATVPAGAVPAVTAPPVSAPAVAAPAVKAGDVPASVAALPPGQKAGEVAAVPPNLRKNWFDCGKPAAPAAFGQPANPFAGAMGNVGAMVNPMAMNGMSAPPVDETTALAALPSPCDGDGPPHMAVIDAVLLRTEDQVTHSYGVNLLQGLTGFFGLISSKSGIDGGHTVSRTKFFGLGGAGSGPAAAAALSYSLNIANAATNRNEVLARPTLLAIDRMPSTFFSGSTVSIAVSGGVAGAFGSLVDKQIGVSFSVTPTFIDDENLLLSVKAVRSFVEQPAGGTTGVALSISRNSVTANIAAKFGETVILSGLTERELVRTDSGVPLLKDIPGIQDMFSTNTGNDFFRTVMIMITPRKPVTSAADIASAEQERRLSRESGKPVNKKYAFYWRVDEYAKVLSKYAPNMDAAIDTLDTNELYKGFKSKDLVDTNWAAKSKLDILLHEVSQLIWH